VSLHSRSFVQENVYAKREGTYRCFERSRALDVRWLFMTCAKSDARSLDYLFGSENGSRMITLHCCGEDYYADGMHIGGHIKCRKCGRFLTIEPKTPLSSTSSGHPVAARSETVVNPPRKVNVRTAWGRRRFPLFKLVLGGALLSVLVVWIAVVRFANREGQSGGWARL
jgi:hypothetical protein